MNGLRLMAAFVVGAASLTAQDLSVADAWKAAEAANKTLQLRQSEFRQAQAGVEEANSRHWPTLSVGSSASYLTNPQKAISLKAGAFGGGMPFQDVELAPAQLNTYFKAQGTVSWPLFTWGKINEAVAIAENQVVLASLKTAKTQDETRRDVRRAYFGVVLARDSLALLRQMETLMKGLMDDRRQNFEQGTVNKEAVLEMQGRLAELTYQRQKTEQALATAVQSLQLLTGLTIDPARLTEAFRTQAPELDPATLGQQAWERSTDRKILERQVELARSNKRIEEASGPLHPDLALNVQFEFAGQDIPYNKDKWTDTWTPNITISIGTQGMIFDGFKADGRVKSADETLVQTQIGLSMLQDGLKVQLQQALENLTDARYALQSKQAAQALAVERARNAEVAYQNEIATREDSQGAALAELMARIDTLAAGFGFENSLIQLEDLLHQSL